MYLSEIGMIAKKPDHFHCIICIGDNQYNYRNHRYCKDTIHCASHPKTNFGTLTAFLILLKSSLLPIALYPRTSPSFSRLYSLPSI